MDLTPHLSSGFTEQFVPSALRRQRNGLYFLPQSIDLSALVWYNRDLFTARGLKPPTTLRAWVELCGRLHQERVLPLAQGNRDLWPMGNFAAELLVQAL